MDEPLAALDEARKAEILPYIERLRDEAGIPVVYVSHAVAEVARLASTVVVLEAGRVAAQGSADAILRRADLMPLQQAEAGVLLDMIVDAHDAASGLTLLAGRVGRLAVPRLDRTIGSPVRVRVPARDVLVALSEPVGLSARNRLSGHILSIDPFGEATAMATIDCGGVALAARLTQASVRDLGLVPGLAVFAIVKSVAFDPDAMGTGRRAVEI
jgi:molybdate transport system ATP-binding protein